MNNAQPSAIGGQSQNGGQANSSTDTKEQAQAANTDPGSGASEVPVDATHSKNQDGSKAAEIKEKNLEGTPPETPPLSLPSPRELAANDGRLTPVEQIDLAALEATFAGGQRESIAALREIRERKLYRENYGTFDLYVEARWKRTRQWATQQINWLRRMELLEAIGKDPYQLSVDDAQALGPLAEEPVLFVRAIEQAEDDARRSGKQRTKTMLQAAVKRFVTYMSMRSHLGTDLTYEESRTLSSLGNGRMLRPNLAEEATAKAAAEGRPLADCLLEACQSHHEFPADEHLLSLARGQDLEVLVQQLVAAKAEWERITELKKQQAALAKQLAEASDQLTPPGKDDEEPEEEEPQEKRGPAKRAAAGNQASGRKRTVKVAKAATVTSTKPAPGEDKPSEEGKPTTESDVKPNGAGNHPATSSPVTEDEIGAADSFVAMVGGMEHAVRALIARSIKSGDKDAVKNAVAEVVRAARAVLTPSEITEIVTVSNTALEKIGPDTLTLTESPTGGQSSGTGESPSVPAAGVNSELPGSSTPEQPIEQAENPSSSTVGPQMTFP